MHTGFFDVLHDAGDQDVVAIGERVDVNFGGVFQEAINEHWPVLREYDGFLHVPPHGVFVIGDGHRAATEHVAGADQDGEAEVARNVDGAVNTSRRAIGRRRDFEIV
jgi:hypothetical protein